MGRGLASPMHAAEPLPHFVDDYLGYLYEVYPTAATMDGVHLHDDLLEDCSRGVLDAADAALAGFARRLDAMGSELLTPVEQVDRAIIAGNIQARRFALERERLWERSPQYYADLIAASLATQAVFTHAPAAERARRVLSKLRQVPRLIHAARANVVDPPGIFVKVGVETLRGIVTFIDEDLPRAFAAVDDLHLLADLADASAEAVQVLGAYVDDLETTVRPRARGSFRLGCERFEEKLRLEEGIDLPADRLLAIAMRELRAVQEEFRATAGRLDGGDPVAAWRAAQRRHPAPGELLATARAQLGELRAFLERQPLVALPEAGDVEVEATPEFFRWSFASMWTPGPFETRPSRSVYYLTDVDPAWPPERQAEHLRTFSVPALWNISIHEVYPGHYVQYQHLRHVESKVRRSTLLAPASYIEGWAHYCEQMMIEAGFGRGDATIRLGQLAKALLRLARFVVAIRLHADDWSVEQGVRFFRDEAFVEESSARREAERGTFDPTYLVYAAGKLMLLKLRREWMEQRPGRAPLRAFHDALLAHGAAPFWALRRLMLDGDTGAVLE